jgi:hypothetical protein
MLRIGFGLVPEQLMQQQRSRVYMKTTKLLAPSTLMPQNNQLHYSKPMLRPRLNLEDFKSTSPKMILNLRYIKKKKKFKSKKKFNTIFFLLK